MNAPLPNRCYLDHAATTPVLAQVRTAVDEAMAHWANPSSPHQEGRASRALLEEARARVKAALGWNGMLVFTSGATEGLHMIWHRAKVDQRLMSAVEHDALQRLDPLTHRLSVDDQGRVDLSALAGRLTGQRPLVAVQAVNNETGVIQPLDDLIPLVRAQGGLVLADCAQSAGKMPLPDADFIVISGHKFGATPGIGALLIRDPAMVEPVGGQEEGYRAGTQNVPAALGMAVALESDRDWLNRIAGLRADVDAVVQKGGGEVVARDAARLASIASYRLPAMQASSQLIRFDMAGIAVSAGSACSSGSLKTSHVLTAMGWDDAAAREVVRVSFGPQTQAADVARFTDQWLQLAAGRKGA